MSQAFERVPVLGISVTPLTCEELIQAIDGLVSNQSVYFVAGHNLHSAYLTLSNARMSEFYDQCEIVVADGFPIARLLTRRGRWHGSPRVGTQDWLPKLGLSSAIRRVALIGSSEHANELACRALQEANPQLQVVGVPGSQWNTSQSDRALKLIREFRPHLTLVGLGMPLQEEFLIDRYPDLPPGVYATVGGAIDQVSGEQTPSPRWLGPLGLEWLWRLLHEPRRLGSRYLLEPFKLARLLIMSRKMNSSPREPS